ncbi:MAG: hypothetical protein PHG47_00140 [Sulfuricella sp.]|nr:hypothetical protein [Sulfuricella sp.]
MNINQIIHNQLDATITNLIRARDKITCMEPDDTQEIGQQIESAAFYLEDIRYNWLSLLHSHVVRHPLTSPNREA